MTSRERVLAAVNHETVDHVPSDIWATPEIWELLKDHFKVDDNRSVKDRLGIDGIESPPFSYFNKEEWRPDGTKVGQWGSIQREQILPTGGSYYEQVYYPLKGQTDIKALDDFDWGDADDYDFEGVASWCKENHSKYALSAGYIAPFVDLWILFGQEHALMNLALYPEFMEAVLERIMDFRLKQHRSFFEAVKDHLDFTQVTDDFGSQTGLVMSHDMIRRFFWPHYRNAIKLGKEYGLKIFHHDDGSMSEIIPDLIQMGVDVINPIQWRCPGMDLKFLKDEYGKDICFHGTVDNQEVIPFGSVKDVRKEVEKNIRILASDGSGFIISSCHNIQSGTPLENVLALYDEVRISGGIN